MSDSGIYRITNTVNGNKYIGSSVNIKKRWIKHLWLLNNNEHDSRHLQNAWNKYGAVCFEFSVIEYSQIGQLLEREQCYIDYEKPIYNTCLTAGSCLGVKRSEEIKKKMSESQLGHTTSEETRNKFRLAGLGRVASEETKHKMSLAATGKHRALGYKHTEEAKRKIGEASVGNQYSFGHVASEETKRKMSEAQKRQWAERKTNEAQMQPRLEIYDAKF